MNYKYKLEDFKDIKELAEWKKECKLLFVVTDNSKYQSPDKAKGCTSDS